MALKINLNDPLMKALKAVNSFGGNSLTPEELKRQRAAMELAGKLAAPSSEVQIEDFEVDAIACEKITPEMAHNPQYVILYAHGGGYTCGGLKYARILASKLALATGFTVISYEYRLSPEYVYPAALEDTDIMWKYILSLGYSPKHIIMAGDSAGGNLSLCFVQKHLTEGIEIPRCLLLFSPWTDMTASSKSYDKYKDKDPILNAEFIESVRQAYTGCEDADYSDSKFSPLYGDFEGFPTTYIQVGKNEILYEDSASLYKKLEKNGIRTELDVEKDGWHVYQQMPLPIATRAMKRLAAFVSREIYCEGRNE